MNLYKKVYVVGAFKTGKSKIVDLLNNMPLCDSSEFKNTLGEVYYNTKPFGDDNYVFVDTEGLFQYTNKFRDNYILKYLLNSISYNCDCLIYVLERTFIHDIEMISKLNHIYQSGKIQQLIIIHNYRNIKQMIDFDHIIEKNKELLSQDALKSGHIRNIDKEDKKGCAHFLIGDNNYMYNHNNKILESIKTMIKAIRIVTQNIEEEKLMENICLSIKNTLYNYYSFDISDSKVIFEYNMFKFVGKSEKRIDNNNDIFDTTSIIINQYDKENHLYLGINCPGIIIDSVRLEILTPFYGRIILRRMTFNHFIDNNEGSIPIFEELHFKSVIIRDQEINYENTKTGIIIIKLKKA